MSNANKIIGDYVTFLQKVDEGLRQVGIDRSEVAMIDHLCYRVETLERYQRILSRCAEIGTLLGESQINGRPIATFELTDYLQAAGWTVPYLELPAPKSSSPYVEGLEHAEAVVVGSLDRFEERHRGLMFTRGGMSQSINPELGLKLDDFSIKFHEQPLGAVVRIEKQLGINEVNQ